MRLKINQLGTRKRSLENLPLGGVSKLKYCAQFHAEEVAPDTVFLFSEKTCHLLRGKLHFLVAPLLKKGQHTADEIAKKLSAEYSIAEIFYVLERLKKAKLIEEVNGKISQEFAAFCQILGTCPKEAQHRLKCTSVHLLSVGKCEKKGVLKALKSLNIRASKTSKNASLVLVLCDHYLNPELPRLQKRFLREKRAWVLAKSLGCELWVGPLFQPEKKKGWETGCWHCLSSRLKRNQIEEGYVRRKKKISSYFSTSIGGLPTSENLANQWIATEIFKCLIQPENSPLKGILRTFDLASSKTQEHILVKQPQCMHCGFLQTQKNSPLTLKSRKKTSFEDGGWRAISPEETLKRHSHQISPILGIVKSLNRAQKNGENFYTYYAGHNFALSNEIRGIYQKSFRSSSGGKGKTEVQAKASALCEAIERYCGVFQGYEKIVRGVFNTLPRPVLDPRSCLQFSHTQYAKRHLLNRRVSAFHYIPEAFQEDKEIDWTPVWSLTERCWKYLPASFCYYGYPEDAIYRGDSNGNAAGNSLEEAILQGFFELVERDSVALWWYNCLKRPAVDLLSFHEPYLSLLIEEYAKLGREIWALDITSDLNIPAFVALSRLKNSPQEKIYFGFGCHFNPQIALVRACTEMNQFLSCAIEDTLEETDSHSKLMLDWFSRATVENQPYLRGDPKKALRTLQDFPMQESQDFLEDIQHCCQILKKENMEMLVLDQTRPDIGLSVVKVIIPGMRHFWPRFAPGRLYDVPVKMGWLKKPKKEQDLNPIAMFL
jgi:bacteriocin biosynthesis cyclodehydratase domain-containing protein